MQNNDFNKLIITGICKDLSDLKFTADGTPVLNFKLFSKMKRKSDTLNVSVWGDLAKTAYMNMREDERILIEGSIQLKTSSNNVFGRNFEIAAYRIYSLENPCEEEWQLSEGVY